MQKTFEFLAAGADFQADALKELERGVPTWGAILIVGAALVVGWWVLRGIILAKHSTEPDCPYDGLPLRWDTDAVNNPASARDYAVFISYKSEDAQIARQLAEAMLAKGIAVWFDDYVIHLHHQDDFEAAIVDGIRRSTNGFLITNRRYFEAQYPRLEMQELVREDRCGAKHLFQIKHPDESLDNPAFPELRLPNDQVYVHAPSDSFADLLRFVGCSLNVDLSDTVILDAPEEPSLYCNEQFGYTLDITDWEPVKEEQHPQHGTVLSGVKWFWPDRVVWNLIVQPRPDLTPRPLHRDGRPLDDKTCKIENADFARRYMQSTGYALRGAHRVFNSGYSHLAITYRNKEAWVRRYSLVFPDRVRMSNLEFAFVFYTSGSFKDLCKLAPRMDRLVSSFRWLFLDKQTAPHNVDDMGNAHD